MVASDLSDLLRRASAMARDGLHAQAVDLVDAWAKTHGERAEIHAFAAQCALAHNDRSSARARLQAALSLRPAWIEVAINLGRLHLAAGEAEMALATFDHALPHAPRDPRLLDGRRRSLFALARYRDAVDAEAEWLAVAPADVAAWIDHANNLMARFRHGEAAVAHARAVALDPDHLPSLWLSAMLVDFVPGSASELDATAQRIDSVLRQFEALSDDDPRLRFHAQALALSATTFGLSLLARDTTALLVRAARQIARFTTLAIGDPPPRPDLRAQGRARIGLVSAHWHRHTVGNLFRCWPLALDRERFDVRLFHLDDTQDEHTAALAASVDQWHSGLRSLRDWRDLLAQQDLDVLIYIDIGLEPLSHALASQRLARRQAATWGQPQTTGLEQVDVFFGTDALEPADAQPHYRERLVRLPHLGLALDPSRWACEAAPPADASTRISLLCAQSASKLHPLHDALFARIAAALPDAVLTLIPSSIDELCDRIRQRIANAIAAAGGDPAKQLRVLSYLPASEYQRTLDASTLVLDSLDFSGFATSLDAIAHRRPVVTMRGALMRGNQTAGLLQLIGLDELVCATADDYVELVIRLARDPARRNDISRRMGEHAQRLLNPSFAPSLNRAIEDLLNSR